MSIKINIGTEAKEQHIVLELDIRKSLSGDFLIFDHGDIDIVGFLRSLRRKVS